MFRFPALTFICLIGMAAGDDVSTPSETVVSRIFGGRTINITEAPYQVALLVDDDYICGGSLITLKMVLSAAHCVKKYYCKLFSVRLGSDQWKTGGKKVQVSECYTHPFFNETSLDYDAAVVRLEKNVQESSTIKTIKLSTSGPISGQFINVSGWGGTFEGLKVTDLLQMVKVQVVSTRICRSRYTSGKTITDRMFCAGSRTGDSCRGDSGGPAVRNGIQVGIVSWGVGCGQFYYPGVYAKISALYDWIKEYLKAV